VEDKAAMSINKQQAAALADGFLDDLGTSKDELQPKESYTELILLAGEMVEEMQENLKRNVASGALSESIAIDEPTQTGDVLRIDITMNDYGRFLNKGVKGWKSGKGLYQFKNTLPSKGMVAALKAGIERAGSKLKSTNRAKTVSANELKNADISEAMAFGAAMNIKKFGIKPTGFLDKAVVSTQKKAGDRFGAALKVDVGEWLSKL
jgi:hypothetical protein